MSFGETSRLLGGGGGGRGHRAQGPAPPSPGRETFQEQEMPELSVKGPAGEAESRRKDITLKEK